MSNAQGDVAKISLCVQHITWISLGPLRSRSQDRMICARDVLGEMCMKDKGGSRSRWGDWDVGLTPEKGEGREKDGGEKNLRHIAALRKSARLTGSPRAHTAHQRNPMSGRNGPVLAPPSCSVTGWEESGETVASGGISESFSTPVTWRCSSRGLSANRTPLCTVSLEGRPGQHLPGLPHHLSICSVRNLS